MNENETQRQKLHYYLTKKKIITGQRVVSSHKQGLSKHYFEIMQEIIIPYLDNPDEAIKRLEALSKEYHHIQANKGGYYKAGRKPKNTQQ